MDTPKSRGDAVSFLAKFVEERRATEFVAESLAQHNIQDVSVAPLANK
jgi:hypothetical protein